MLSRMRFGLATYSLELLPKKEMDPGDGEAVLLFHAGAWIGGRLGEVTDEEVQKQYDDTRARPCFA